MYYETTESCPGGNRGRVLKPPGQKITALLSRRTGSGNSGGLPGAFLPGPGAGEYGGVADRRAGQSGRRGGGHAPGVRAAVLLRPAYRPLGDSASAGVRLSLPAQILYRFLGIYRHLSFPIAGDRVPVHPAPREGTGGSGKPAKILSGTTRLLSVRWGRRCRSRN